ncbi:response regulator [Candidatus Methylocalor cossyra]|uniref:DNA-binding transcriptional activator KdpE n=1 Tax=Candidatus Methylocalor cossyra TaxID=3108543 RepID=A0ABP1C9K3_9GAMM
MTQAPPVVVVIEDDPPLRRFLRTGLASQGFQVVEAETGQQGLVEAGTRKPDLVILDLGLPDRDGVEVIRALREWTTLPIIVLSARGGEQDKIDALDNGADDYVTKPFGLGELLARIRVALRHANTPPEGGAADLFTTGALTVDLRKRLVWVDGREVHLTPLQYRLLQTLVKHAGKVLTHHQLLREVWGPTYVEHAHYLRIYMSQLRHKLEKDPTKPEYLLTESGVGYRLKI